MGAKEKAIQLVDNYRMLLMNEDTDCGNEILCSMIAKKCALVSVDEILHQFRWRPSVGHSYWEEVKTEIEKL